MDKTRRIVFPPSPVMMLHNERREKERITAVRIRQRTVRRGFVIECSTFSLKYREKRQSNVYPSFFLYSPFK